MRLDGLAITLAYSAGLLLLMALLWSSLSRNLYRRGYLVAKEIGGRLLKDCESLTVENERLRLEIADLQRGLEQTIAIYNVTKQLCRSLDAEKVFQSFSEEVRKYIQVEECLFLKNPPDPQQYRGYIVLPLELERSTFGYLIARVPREEDAEKFHILAQQFILGIKRAILYQRVQELAITDSLTSVFSRRYYMERFKEEIERSLGFNYNFSCLMIDIDNFKTYNDSYGHLVGDAILKEVAKTTKESIRQIDLMGRYGGEEFSIILTETGREQARFVAERIRQAIEEKPVRVYDEDLRVTVSIGISTFPYDGKDIATLVDNADRALYVAKQAGRNSVRVFGEHA